MMTNTTETTAATTVLSTSSEMVVSDEAEDPNSSCLDFIQPCEDVMRILSNFSRQFSRHQESMAETLNNLTLEELASKEVSVAHINDLVDRNLDRLVNQSSEHKALLLESLDHVASQYAVIRGSIDSARVILLNTTLEGFDGLKNLMANQSLRFSDLLTSQWLKFSQGVSNQTNVLTSDVSKLTRDMTRQVIEFMTESFKTMSGQFHYEAEDRVTAGNFSYIKTINFQIFFILFLVSHKLYGNGYSSPYSFLSVEQNQTSYKLFLKQLSIF